MKTISFIGMGNMAQALAQGLLRSGEDLTVCAYAPHQDKLKANAERIGFTPMASPEEAAAAADTVIMACKPYQVEAVIGQIGAILPGKALLSVAAGWDFERYAQILPEGVRFQYIMPNTPAMVGAGMFMLEDKNSLTEEERKECISLFSAMGMVEELPSAQMELGSALAGCGPAFVDMMMQAFADAGVKHGMQRDRAYRLLSQMIVGAGLLQQKTGEHPEALKDKVCSPGGTTIRGCAALEDAGFRSACISAIDAVMGRIHP